jgi:hypothetical protein
MKPTPGKCMTKKLYYEKRRLGQDYQTELETLIYLGLGKII